MAGADPESTLHPCLQYDVVSWSLGEQGTPAFREHLQECSLCGEEREEARAFFATDPAEELAEEYRNLHLQWIAVPASLVERLFPKTVWEQVLDELKKQWSALSRSPFAEIAWEPTRIQVEGKLSPEKRPRYYTGQHITLRLRIDEDCHVTILHMDGRGNLRQVFPEPGQTGFLQRGTYEFPGLAEGTHEEEQRLIVLATTPAVAFPLLAAAPGQQWLATLRQQLAALPGGAWSWSEHTYQVMEPGRVSLADLAESCRLEIQDKSDKDMAACGEVCRRTLGSTLPRENRQEAFQVFHKITAPLVYRWVHSWLRNIPPEQRQEAEEYVQEVYSRLLAAMVQYRGYFSLLHYMKEITARVVIQDYRKPKREIISRLRTKLNGPWLRSGNDHAVRKLLPCLRHYGLNDPVDVVLLEGLLKGQGAPELREHPVLQELFSQSQAKSLEKLILNRRDTAIWHAFKSMRQIQQRPGDDECREAVESILT